jgi:hypothetical protein
MEATHRLNQLGLRQDGFASPFFVRLVGRPVSVLVMDQVKQEEAQRARLVARLIEKGSTEKYPEVWLRALTLRALRVLDTRGDTPSAKGLARRQIHDIRRDVSLGLKKPDTPEGGRTHWKKDASGQRPVEVERQGGKREQRGEPDSLAQRRRAMP